MLRVLGLAGLIMAACAGVRPAAATTTWAEIGCPAAELYLSDLLNCKTATAGLPGTVISSQRAFQTFGQTSRFFASLNLSITETYYAPWAADASQTNIRGYLGTLLEKTTAWSDYQGFRDTGHMSFKFGSWHGIGIDHAGDRRSTAHACTGIGYGFILRGYFCDAKPAADSAQRVREVLAAVRIGPPASPRNAFGEPVAPSDIGPPRATR